MATVERLLQTVGKRTFINCFEALEEGETGLTENEVLDADSPDSEDWEESSLYMKTNAFNQIIGEERECDALEMCFEARIGRRMQHKARKLYDEYCDF